LVYLPKGVMDPHDLPATTPRVGRLPEQVLETLPKAATAVPDPAATAAEPGATPQP
jgi:hypothetical protein